MYKKVISKIRCYSPNHRSTPTRNYNNLYYIATREGVDLRPLEDELGPKNDVSDNATYVRYIHERPHSNGLFGNIETSDILSVCNMIRAMSENQCIYRGILSLSEEDAIALDFMDKTAWNDFLIASLPEISEILGIPATELQWVAAFHQESGHPHVHYMLWSDNMNRIQSPFISVPQQHKCRELFSNRFFAEERSQLSFYKSQTRKIILTQGKKEAQADIQRLVDEVLQQPSFRYLHRVDRELLQTSSQELLKLLDLLPATGSISYAYLSSDAKQQVDKIIAFMLQKPELNAEYNSFLNYHKKIAETYSPTKKELQIAILKGKKDIDRRLANIVLKSAKELLKDKEFYYRLIQSNLPSYYHSLLKYGISQNTIDTLKKEAKNGDATAAYLLGRIYDDPNGIYHDPATAFHYYKQAANANNADAQGILGSKYIFGKDVNADEELGRKYLHAAKDQGNEYAKATENAYDSYQTERSVYKTLSLMSDLLNNLCFANHTRKPSSVYHNSIDKSNKKLLRERARQNPHKHNKELSR